ncbi:MAG: hypothetical protein QM535_05485 [Limnohabitans sp.]|nr:hypothetical protein [Limnohabitans sp.]
MDTANKKWNELTVKDQTISYINHIEEKYYRSYLKESEDFERINNIFHLLIIVSGFLTTIMLALKYLLNKAKIDFTLCQTDEDYKNLYYWLNDEIKKLQLYQSSGYFIAQETMYSNKA